MTQQTFTSRLRYRLAQAVLGNMGLKLVAFAGALALWSYVASQPRMERVFEAFIRYVNVPSDLELNPDQADQVTVVLSGPRNRLNELERRELTVEADLSEVFGPGEHTFNVTPNSLGLPPGVALVRAVPSQLRLLLERRVSREVAVQPRFVGAFQPGYFLDSYVVNPPRLVIEGPESHMRLIDQVTTDPIDVSQAVGPANFRVMAYVPDPYVRFAGDASVTVEVLVRKRH